MLGFLLALQFLTIIPVKLKHIDVKKIGASMIWFPFIGLILGLFLVILSDMLNLLNFPGLTIDIIVIIALIYICGGLHSDGLSDTFDAICSGKNKEEMLRIMRDSSSGPMGNLAVTSVILLKIALLYAISGGLRANALMLMCILGRWSMVMGMFFFPYARCEGKAKAYMANMNMKTFYLSTFIALVFALMIFKIYGVLIFLLAGFGAYILGSFFKKKFDGITGDTLGAMNEIIETIVLFIIVIIGRIHYG